MPSTHIKAFSQANTIVSCLILKLTQLSNRYLYFPFKTFHSN